MDCASRPQQAGRSAAAAGFTLVELLVVIGIAVLLMGILLPTLGRAREQANKIACGSNLRTLGQALFVYANVYPDRLPNGNPPLVYVDFAGANEIMKVFAAEYAKDARVFWCPADRDPQPTQILSAEQNVVDSARVSYEFYFLFWPPERGPLLSRLKGEAPLAWDLDGAEAASPAQNHGNRGGHVVFADGHVAWQPAAEWGGPSWPRPAAKYYER